MKLEEKNFRSAENVKEELVQTLEKLRARVSELESLLAELKPEDGLLQPREEQYRNIVESIPDPYTELDLAGSNQYFNDPYVEVMGYSRDELQGLNYRVYMDEENRKRAFRAFNSVYETGNPTPSVELEWITNSGEKRHAEMSISPIRNAQGIIIGFRSLFHDMTERLKMEEALRISEERLRLITNSMIDVLVLVDKDFVIRYASPSLVQLTGFEIADRIGKQGYEMIHPEDLPRVLDLVEKVISAKSHGKAEYRVKHVNGGYIWIETVGTLILDHDNQIVGAVFNLRDISERKKIEDALKNSMSELEYRVQERTSELQEANTALRVLLGRRMEDQRSLEERLRMNINDLIIPIISEMKNQHMDSRVLAYVNLLETNLKDIASPFLKKATTITSHLTSKEIQVVNMIREGMRTREIAELLGVAKATVDTHRNNIREKLGLVKGKANLRSYLLSIK